MITTVNAATLYLSPNQLTMNRGDSTVLSVRLDVDDGECVNVVDGVLTYSDNIEPVDISRGDSILSIWVEDPIINREERTISFAGGIPNGYCGRIAGDPRLTNNVLNLIVASPGFVIGGSGAGTATQTAAVNFTEATQVFLNDGTGNQAPLTTYGASIVLDPTAGQNTNDWQERIVSDDTPPNAFSITLERSPNAFSNDYFITFNTTDKQTGIDHYEVMEEPLDQLSLLQWGREDAPWINARSPYVLKDQTLNSTIRVRAIDKAGNEYVATLIPDESQRTMSLETVVLLVLLSLAALGVAGTLILFVFKTLRARQRRQGEAEQEYDLQGEEEFDEEGDYEDDDDEEDDDEESDYQLEDEDYERNK